jgi:hypothetical protein
LQELSKGEGRGLTISSGDISDVDGFFALAEYSKVTNTLIKTFIIPQTQKISAIILSFDLTVLTLWTKDRSRCAVRHELSSVRW